MSYTSGPLTANIVATKDGMYSIRDAMGERVGLAFTRDDALLWSQAPALLAACEVAADVLESLALGTMPVGKRLHEIGRALRASNAAIAAATKS